MSRVGYNPKHWRFLHISTLKTVEDVWFATESVAREALSGYHFYLNVGQHRIFAKGIAYSRTTLVEMGLLNHIIPLQACEFEVVFIEEQH